MSRFFKTLLKFSVFPLFMVLALTGYYIYTDPFKILYNYKDYSFTNVIPNRDYISTQSFINRYEHNHYNSFIFGSSRTLGFKTDSWKMYLDSTAVPFVFDASSESLRGIYKKIKYLDSLHIKMDHILILLCHDCSFLDTYEQSGHLIIKHCSTSHHSQLKFHLSFLKAYFDNKFLSRYLVYKATGTYKPWMRGYIEYRKITYDTLSNELRILDQENEIEADEDAYYLKRRDVFYDRKKEKVDSLKIINDLNKSYLREISDILRKQNAKYKIILSPLYEQVKYQPADMQFLSNLFGDKLYDFSGKNSFTENYRNYYESSHFRPLVGDSILKIIYSKNSTAL